MKMEATQAVKNDIANLHRGLHASMDALIRQKDYRETERILREVDQRMTTLLRTIKIAR